MEQNQPDGFRNTISRCRQVYAIFQQLAARTDEALYGALGESYALLFRMLSDRALRTEFDRLLNSTPGTDRLTKPYSW